MSLPRRAVNRPADDPGIAAFASRYKWCLFPAVQQGGQAASKTARFKHPEQRTKRRTGETLYPHVRSPAMRDRIPYTNRTERRHPIISGSETFGRVTMLGSTVQFSREDEFIYHG
jgi:hypothetical protein